MTRLPRLRSWLRAVFRRPHLNQELGEELEFHVEQYAEDLQRQGVSPTEAVRRARAELGSFDARREECRQSLGLRLIDELRGDVRYAVRMLGKARGFTAVTVLTLALALGGSTAVFSAVDAIVLRPLPYHEPDRLAVIGTRQMAAGDSRLSPVAPEDFAQWRGFTELFQQLAAYTPTSGVTLREPARDPEELRTLAVSPKFFDVLGVRPLVGRAFAREHDIEDGQHAAVISYELWQSHFSGAPDILGRLISLQEETYRITGVMPREFSFTVPSVPVFLIGPIQVFVPLEISGEQAGRIRKASVWPVGRLADGVSHEAASERMNQLASTLATGRTGGNDRRVEIVPLADHLVGGSTRRWMLLLLGAVTPILLIACANVASLLLARASIRGREIGIRAALGAGRWRIARQLMIESAVLSVAGLAAGLVFAWWGIGVLRAAMPDTMPGATTMRLDLRVLLAAAAATAASALLFGVLPALRGSRADLTTAVKDAGHGSSTGRGARRLRQALVVVEVALAAVLVVGAGLFIGSFTKLMQVDLGYDPRHVLTAGVFPTEAGARARTAPGLLEIVDRLKAAPDVEYASAIAGSVLFARNPGVSVAPVAGPDGRPGRIFISEVTADYHRALRIPLRMGRYLDEGDSRSADPVAIINQTAARAFFAGQNPLDRSLKLLGGLGDRRIVGVVADTRVGLEGATPAVVFVPLGQRPLPFGYLVVRTAGDPTATLPTVRAAVRSALPGQAIREGRSLEEIHARMAAQRRLSMELLTLFGAFGLTIAAVGVYGVMAYIVSQQTREIGIRMALGATAASVTGVFLRQAAGVVVLGLSIGAAGAWILSASAKPFLFEMEPTEPAVFAGALLVLASAALASGVIPARRAAAVDPSAALRRE